MESIVIGYSETVKNLFYIAVVEELACTHLD